MQRHRSNTPVAEGPEAHRVTLRLVAVIFEVTDEHFALTFPIGQDIAFIDEVHQRSSDEVELSRVFEAMWGRRIPKPGVKGVHGLLFFQLEDKKAFYSTRKDEEAQSGGFRLRSENVLVYESAE